ncbi:hypothetical protein SLA2020_253280 [Shorea laevis]
MPQENIQLIGSLFPRLISWDNSTLGGLESFLRLRVEIDVHVPLLSGFQFQKPGDEICSANFKYEKLLDFCCRCGMLGHTQKSCNDFRWKDDDGNYITQSRPQYGPHMRAQAYSPRRYFGSIREGKQTTIMHVGAPANSPPIQRMDMHTTMEELSPAENKLLADVDAVGEQTEA